jgi:hypothetical protein
VNKQSFEYQRIQEEIAKKLFQQTYQFTLESEVTKNKMNRVWAFKSYDEMGKGNKDAWRKMADDILTIKGLTISADDQLNYINHCVDEYGMHRYNMSLKGFKKLAE